MKKTIILLFISILILSCSKKNDDEIIEEPSLETFKISSEQTTIKPLELVLISSSEINFNLDSYKGKINDIEIDLIKTENNELLFTVPSVINTGSASLELMVENKKGKLSFNIIENNVQDVGSVINNELLTPFSEFESELDDLIANNTNSLIVNEQLTSAKQMLQNYRTKYNTLSNDEKIEVAKFFNANPVFTSDFLNLSNKNTNHLNGNSDYDCFKFNSKKVVYTTITILTFVNYLPHLTRVGPLGSVAALSGFIAGVYAAVAIISAAQEQLLNDCFLPFENLLKDDSGNTNNFELNNESNYTFSIISRDRKLISSDLNSSNSLLSSTVKRWNNAKQKWNKLKNGINNIISSTTNWFSSWFGSSSSFKTITYEFEDLPSSSDETETEGDSEYISIEDFPSDVEVEYSIASDNSINLKFKADVSTLPRTITGKIKYDDNDFSNENEFSVTIDNGIFGTWKIDAADTCTNTDGSTFSDTYSGEIILNEDYTVTYVGIDNSNTISNSFTFSNNTLTITTTYNDYTTTPCGEDSQLVTDIQTLQLDPNDNTFSGTTHSSADDVDVINQGNTCTILGRTCSGTIKLTR